MDILTLSPTALVLALASGAGYGLSGLVNKRASQLASPLMVMAIMFLVCAILGLVGFLWAPQSRLTSAYWLPFAASVITNCIGNFCYLSALQRTPVSLVGASAGLMPVFAALTAWLILGETLTDKQWLGIVLSFIGLVITYIPARATAVERHDFGAFFKHRGAGLLLLAMASWSAAIPFDKQAAQAASVPLHMLLIYAALSTVAFTSLWYRDPHALRHLATRDLTIIGAAGLLRGLAYNWQLAALVVTPVGVLELVKRLAIPLISLAGGRIWFGEKLNFTKLLGTAIFIFGLPLVIFK